jgi:hypothetical protein
MWIDSIRDECTGDVEEVRRLEKVLGDGASEENGAFGGKCMMTGFLK